MCSSDLEKDRFVWLFVARLPFGAREIDLVCKIDLSGQHMGLVRGRFGRKYTFMTPVVPNCLRKI